MCKYVQYTAHAQLINYDYDYNYVHVMYDDHKLQILVTTCTKRKGFFVSAEYEYVQVNVLMHTHMQIHVFASSS